MLAYCEHIHFVFLLVDASMLLYQGVNLFELKGQSNKDDLFQMAIQLRHKMKFQVVC